MVIPSNLWEYILTSMLIILAPGPSVLFIIARAIAWGRMTAVFTVIGNASGVFLLSVLIAVGLGPLLQRSDVAYGAIQWGGGAYLVYLGIDALRQRHVHAQEMAKGKGAHPSPMRSARDGFLVGILNPKTLVFFAAVLPQFIDRERGSVTSQLLLLGALFCTMAALSDGTWGLVAGTARIWLSGEASRLVALRTAGGVVMMILGALVIISAIRYAFS
ncbi:MAG: LysE family translocator [Actinobacteria bacterium]|nr:LysE family translocator [Actinomycetota bacterium]